ncbi:MAG TPA: NUDIX domain-containing protein [Chthoniobacterales bacterium]|nr:NUDIX domain-containing protein [Chthoniobacterales bacterium]
MIQARLRDGTLVAAAQRHVRIFTVSQVSAGLLMYRKSGSILEVFLVHPGGPFWAKKDEGAWSIPKGLIDEGEDRLEAAKREFLEETSIRPAEPFIYLGEIKQKSGKRVHAWAFAGNCDLSQMNSNTFTLEWPPKSGQMKEFPEIDKGEFFSVPDARRKITPSQADFLVRLTNYLERLNE